MLARNDSIVRVLCWALSRAYPYNQNWYNHMRRVKDHLEKLNTKDRWEMDIFATACAELRMSQDEILEMRLLLWDNPDANPV